MLYCAAILVVLIHFIYSVLINTLPTLLILAYVLQKLPFLALVNDRVVTAFLDGSSMNSQCVTSHFFWHNLWLECGRPKTGAVADCLRRTRAANHYAIRKVKRDEDTIINERIADSILNNDARGFWSEIKGIRSNKAGTSRITDGKQRVLA
jgi:hypothetical protein